MGGALAGSHLRAVGDLRMRRLQFAVGDSRSPQWDEDEEVDAVGQLRYRLNRVLTCAREIKDYTARDVHTFTR